MKAHIRQNGIDLPTVQHEGQQWAITPPEGEYKIVLYNDSSMRRLAVVTVDGVSVIDAKDGSRDGNGYVLEPWQTFVIKGWRRSDSKAAAFRFTPNGDSYVAQMGRGTRNTGVIAVAVFDERPKSQVVYVPPVVIPYVPPVVIPWVIPGPRPHPHIWYGVSNGYVPLSHTFTTANAVHDGAPCSVNMVQCSASVDPDLRCVGLGNAVAMPPEQRDLGTGFGREVEMRTCTTTFERVSKVPAEEIVIRYGLRERLAALGVPVEKAHAPSAPAPTPDPFPGSACPAPPGWDG